MDNCPKKDCHEPNALIFKKVVIPASVADDRVNPPKNGDYCNMLVKYEASGNVYIFSSDGIPTMISVDMGDINYAELLNKPKINSVELVGDKSLEDLGITGAINDAVADEADIRSTADQEIWTEIEAIEAGSDVVDIVGTYAELQQYDTSTLQNNDVIKVLTDETHDNAISYYRWNATTQTFTYVGSEGPYYTASETDTLLAAKQDKLIAGSNIQIATDGKTISATDTTYTHFTGATASADGTAGLVPAPVAGDEDKYLKADGTWATVQSGGAQTVTLYPKFTGLNPTVFGGLFKDQALTEEAYGLEVVQMMRDGTVLVDMGVGSDGIFKIAYGYDGDEGVHLFEAYGYEMVIGPNSNGSGCIRMHIRSYQESTGSYSFQKVVFQPRLTAGTNITISDNTISATDTTYSNFVGTDGTAAGAAGLVPAPAVTDDNKYLKSDGTWATVQSGGATAVTYYTTTSSSAIYSDQSMTTVASYGDIETDINNGKVMVYISDLGVLSEIVDSSSLTVLGVTTTTFIGAMGDGTISFVYIDDGNTTTLTITRRMNQGVLTAGSNISIGTVQGVDNTISVTGMPVLYGSQGQNTDGAVTQKVFTDTVGDVESILQILNSGAGV